jgi:hypothetical protein
MLTRTIPYLTHANRFDEKWEWLLGKAIEINRLNLKIVPGTVEFYLQAFRKKSAPVPRLNDRSFLKIDNLRPFFT